MKRCKVCLELKPLSDFYRSADMRDGHRNDCKTCKRAAKKARYQADPAVAIARVKRWQQENADRSNEYRRRRRKLPVIKQREREGHLKRKFGISVEQYESRLADQGGGCTICGDPPPAGGSLHVDHDHVGARVRGLLCFRCNGGIGQFRDDLELLEAALLYVAAKRRVHGLVAQGHRLVARGHGPLPRRTASSGPEVRAASLAQR